MNDTVRFDVSAPNVSWSVQADLTAGTVQARSGQAQASGTLTPAQVTHLRALLEPLHSSGNHHSRSQFASGMEEWVICLDGETVTIRYEDETTVSPRKLWKWAVATRDRLI